MRRGGTSEPMDAEAHHQELAEKIKNLAEGKVNKKFDEFTVIKVSRQVVAGTNYFMKVHVGNEEYAHLRVFVPLPCNGTEPELHGIQHPKTKDCQLAYFEKD